MKNKYYIKFDKGEISSLYIKENINTHCFNRKEESYIQKTKLSTTKKAGFIEISEMVFLNFVDSFASGFKNKIEKILKITSDTNFEKSNNKLVDSLKDIFESLNNNMPFSPKCKYRIVKNGLIIMGFSHRGIDELIPLVDELIANGDNLFIFDRYGKIQMQIPSDWFDKNTNIYYYNHER